MNLSGRLIILAELTIAGNKNNIFQMSHLIVALLFALFYICINFKKSQIKYIKARVKFDNEQRDNRDHQRFASVVLC